MQANSALLVTPVRQQRPGLIQLPQPLSPATRMSTPSSRRSQQQLRTPSPTPNKRRNKRNSFQQQQRRSSAAAVVAPLSPPLTDVEPSPKDKDDLSDVSLEITDSMMMLSPPPTPPSQHQTTRRSKKAKAAPPLLTQDQAARSLASPPPSPLVHKFARARELLGAPTKTTSTLLPAFDLAPKGSSSEESLPLAEDDEVIIWKQPTPPSSTSSSPVSDRTRSRSPSRSPSPSAFIDWEVIKNLPRPDAATIAWLKEKYDIRPSTPSQYVKRPVHPASCPSTPPLPIATPTQPIPITRRPHGAHVRAPSVPTFPTSGRLALAQVKEDVAELFGLDIDDLKAVTKATEAMRAYSGSTFNVSSEMDRAPAPKFLGRLFN